MTPSSRSASRIPRRGGWLLASLLAFPARSAPQAPPVSSAAEAAATSPEGLEEPAGPAERARRLVEDGDRLRTAGTEEEAVASLVAYDQAAALARGLGDDTTLARALHGKARALLATGAGEEAEPVLELALTAAARSGPALETEVRRTLADALAGRGRFAEALPHLEALARMAEAAGDLEIAGYTHLDAAEVARSAARLDRALREAGAAVASFHAAGATSLELQALERRAALESESGDQARALETLRALVALASEAGDSARAGSALVHAAEATRVLGREEEALTLLDDALDRCGAASDRRCEAEAREVQASLLLALRRPQAAAGAALAALVARRELGDSQGQGRAHHALGAALAQLDRLEPALAAFAEATPLLEPAGADERAELLVAKARAHAGLRQGESASEAYESALETLRAAGRTAGRFQPSVDRAAVVEEHLENLVREGLWARALELALAGKDRGARPVGSPGSEGVLDVDVLRSVTLVEGAPLVAWHALDDSLLAWVVTPDGRVSGTRVEGVGRREIADLASALLREVRPASPSSSAAPASPGPGTVADDAPRRRLHDALLGSLDRDLLGGTGGLVAWKDAALRDVPLEVLLDDEGEALASRFVVAELPAAELPRPEPRRGSVVVVDGPGAGLLSAVVASREAPREPRGRDVPGRPRPAAAAPVAEILEGPAATEGEVRLRAPGAAAIVVLATCDASGVVLAPDAASAGEEGDGRLTPAEIARMDLRGAVVVLASCPSDDAIAEALLDAGTRSLVSLRWQLDDAARALLASVLTRELGAGRSVADAVAAATSGLRAERPDPATWGSVRLLGSLR